MIEKKIRYDINIEKPSKTKPFKQGGVLNYLGKQKIVKAPLHWRSSSKHPVTHLAYITKDEEKILVDLDLYNSLKGKPNKGPSGIMSLNGGGGGGDGGGDGGSSGGDGSSSGDSSGDSGPGGSDDGSSSGVGSGEGDSTGDAGDQGGTEGPGDDSGSMGGLGMGDVGGLGIGGGMSVGDVAGTSDDSGLGGLSGSAIGEAAVSAAAEAAEADVDMSMPALQSLTDKAMAQARNTFSVPGIVGGLVGMMTGLPGGFAIGSNIASGMARGVTGPSDDTQEQSSVQSGPAQSASDGGGGITTISNYAPLTNVSTGDNTADAIRTRLENLLKPTTTVTPTLPNVSSLSGYTLADLIRLRGI